jgi:hypothetical protein
MLVECMNLKKKFGKVFTSKVVGTGPSSYEKRIYQAAVSQRLRNTVLEGRLCSVCNPTGVIQKLKIQMGGRGR